MQAASDKQASDILLLDTRDVCTFTDYFVICSADSDRQIEAIREEITKTLKQKGILPYHRAGNADSGWILLDMGAVIIHIFSPQQREYYNLDELWGEAVPVVRIQ